MKQIFHKSVFLASQITTFLNYFIQMFPGEMASYFPGCDIGGVLIGHFALLFPCCCHQSWVGNECPALSNSSGTQNSYPAEGYRTFLIKKRNHYVYNINESAHLVCKTYFQVPILQFFTSLGYFKCRVISPVFPLSPT